MQLKIGHSLIFRFSLYLILVILLFGSCSPRFSKDNRSVIDFFFNDMGDSIQFGITPKWKHTYHREFSWPDVSYIIDSTQMILYMNDYGYEIQMINLVDGKVLNSFNLNLYRRAMMGESELRLISNSLPYTF